MRTTWQRSWRAYSAEDPSADLGGDGQFTYTDIAVYCDNCEPDRESTKSEVDIWLAGQNVDKIVVVPVTLHRP